jgi:hypothetical protein
VILIIQRNNIYLFVMVGIISLIFLEYYLLHFLYFTVSFVFRKYNHDLHVANGYCLKEKNLECAHSKKFKGYIPTYEEAHITLC